MFDVRTLHEVEEKERKKGKGKAKQIQNCDYRWMKGKRKERIRKAWEV